MGKDGMVDVALIGIGNRAAEIEMEFSKTGLMNVLALCDVDLEGSQNAYAIQKYPQAKKYTDFRKLFDEMAPQLDGVIVATPDHSHFPICIRAIREGINVYCEKPLARTFLENEILRKAALTHPEVVTQMGNQGHSGGAYFQFKKWVEEGIIKDVTKIDVFMNEERRWFRYDTGINRFPQGQAIPKNMDWDTWLGSTMYHDFNEEFHQGNWRSWYDFGMGALGDWGAHLFDTAHEFLDLGLPCEVEVIKAEGHNDYFFPMASTLRFHFPRRGSMPALDLYWYDGKDNYPEFPEGFMMNPKHPGYIAPGKVIYSKTLTFQGGHHDQKLKIIPQAVADEMASSLPYIAKSPSNHFLNFLRACKGEEKTRSPFEIATGLCEVFNIGVIAQRLGHGFKFDRVAKRVIDDPFADAMLSDIPPRKGWEDYYTLE